MQRSKAFFPRSPLGRVRMARDAQPFRPLSGENRSYTADSPTTAELDDLIEIAADGQRGP